MLIAFGCGGSTRDVVPESEDVHSKSIGPAGGSTYEYVAKRPFATVAVAESRGMSPEAVHGAIDRLADSVDACAARLERDGKLAAAAARVAARIDDEGGPTGLALTLTPGPGPTAVALLCFISPFKLTRFPAAEKTGASRGIAVEASWGPPSVSPPP